MKFLLLLFALLIVGCSETVGVDQKMRQKIFLECMRNLPNGPNVAHYNDWAEIVCECESAAYYQSKRVAHSDSVVGGIIK